MHDAHAFLQTLALVLCAAAVTSVVFQWLRQPVVLGYLLAGMMIGPDVPVPFFADTGTVQTLAELGVILLMFSLGIEFSLPKLLRVGPTAGLVAIVQCSLMIWLGYLAGQAFGWSPVECLFAGAMVAISSTTIVVKAFQEQQVRGDFTHMVFGILIVQDLIAIMLMTLLTAISHEGELNALEIARTAGRLAAFLAALSVAGLLVVPRLVRAVVRLKSEETIVVASIGIAFGFSLLAATFGYSVALGAFLAGALVAESGVERTIERLVEPVRDIFVAIFFVSVGMLIDPAEVVSQWATVLVFFAVVALGMSCSITIGTFLTGQNVQTSVKTGMSLTQIGEFSFIIVQIGTRGGAIDKRLYAVAVAVSAITAMLTPWLVHASSPTAAWVDKKLPRPLQTFGALYSSWLEQLRAGSPERESARIRRAVRWLIVDAGLIAAIVIGASVEMERIATFAQRSLDVPEKWTRFVVIAGAVLASAPFWIGLVQTARYLGFALATRVFPTVAGEQVDLAAAPRRLLIVTLQLAIVLLVGVPLIAVTQPFLPLFRGAAVLLLVVILLAIAFWRGAANFQGHARAVAQVLVEALARQTRKGWLKEADHGLESANRVLAGLGSPVPIEVLPGSQVVGKSLAQIQLRGLTGATVLAIQRSGESVLIPAGPERLRAGDILAIAGSRDAIEAARTLLMSRDSPSTAE